MTIINKIYNMKKVIILVLIAISFSSCYTIQQATMSNNQLMTKCPWTD